MEQSIPKKIYENINQSIEIVEALKVLIKHDFGVDDEQAQKIVEKVSEYDVNGVTDIFHVIEHKMGYKLVFIKNIKGKE